MTAHFGAERRVALMISRPQHEHVDLGLPDNDNDQTEDLRRPVHERLTQNPLHDN